jgi:hypothetical protein
LYEDWCFCLTPPNTDKNYKHRDFEDVGLFHALSTPTTVTKGRVGQAKYPDSNPGKGEVFFIAKKEHIGCELNPTYWRQFRRR